MRATNIKWDTDGDMEIFNSLPHEMKIPERFSKEHYFDENGNFGEADREEMLEDISDWLSDETGFCHAGFKLLCDDGNEVED